MSTLEAAVGVIDGGAELRRINVSALNACRSTDLQRDEEKHLLLLEAPSFVTVRRVQRLGGREFPPVCR